jgi:adenine deaminase
VKYGGVSEEEAWKFVTLNPAKLLHIDHRVGSLAPGKDADVVIWSEHPLSIYARAEATFVDGRLYFDLASDAALRASMVRERGVAHCLQQRAPTSRRSCSCAPVMRKRLQVRLQRSLPAPRSLREQLPTSHTFESGALTRRVNTALP